MDVNSDRSFEDIKEMIKDFTELKQEINSKDFQEAELTEDLDYLNESLDVLLEELKSVKSEKDLTIKKNIIIDALLTWIVQFLPEVFEDGDEEDFDLVEEVDE